MPGQSTAMGEQVADRDVGRRQLILQREAGIDVADSAVPRDLAVAHQTRDHGRGQRLGDRCELEDRICADGRRLADFTHAEAVEQDDLVAIHDGDREPGHEPLVDDLPCEFPELGQCCSDLLLGRRLGERRQRNEQRRNAGEQCPPDNRAAWINAQGHGLEITEGALPGAAEMGSRPTDATRGGRSRCGVRVFPLC